MAVTMNIAPGEHAMGTTSPISSKSLLRKIDWRLLPLMMFSYMLQFLDKQTLGQSAIMGVIQDLRLTGNQFSWAGSIFYFAYLAFSYPVSMLMVRLPIGKFLAVNVFLWGGVLACHAATSNFTGLMVTRFFLGATEAAVSPGFSLITGIWYTREEQPLRHGLWFAGNSLATMFGGLVAYGVAHIRGSIVAWKWLFIIYGVITMVWSVLLVFFLPDSPATARFLRREEREAAGERTKANQTGTKRNVIEWDQVGEALLDYKIWLLFVFQVANNLPNGGLTTFGALVLAGFGFSTLQVYLLQMPMGFVHAIFAVGRLVRSTRLLVSSNVAGFTKKATVSAMMFIAYCTGNIAGPFLFFDDEAPSYDSGFISIIVCLAVATVLILVLGFCWRWENRRRDTAYGPPVAVAASEEDEGKPGAIPAVAVEDLTDVKNHNFRYVF